MSTKSYTMPRPSVQERKGFSYTLPSSVAATRYGASTPLQPQSADGTDYDIFPSWDSSQIAGVGPMAQLPRKGVLRVKVRSRAKTDETSYLMSSRANADHLARSIASLEAGKGICRELLG